MRILQFQTPLRGLEIFEHPCIHFRSFVERGVILLRFHEWQNLVEIFLVLEVVLVGDGVCEQDQGWCEFRGMLNKLDWHAFA